MSWGVLGECALCDADPACLVHLSASRASLREARQSLRYYSSAPSQSAPRPGGLLGAGGATVYITGANPLYLLPYTGSGSFSSWQQPTPQQAQVDELRRLVSLLKVLHDLLQWIVIQAKMLSSQTSQSVPAARPAHMSPCWLRHTLEIRGRPHRWIHSLIN